jgi:hypothetical protein
MATRRGELGGKSGGGGGRPEKASGSASRPKKAAAPKNGPASGERATKKIAIVREPAPARGSGKLSPVKLASSRPARVAKGEPSRAFDDTPVETTRMAREPRAQSMVAQALRLAERADAGLAPAGGESTGRARVPVHGKPGAEPPPVSRVADSRGKYVYCVIQTNEPLRFGRLGIGGEAADVHTINYKNIAAIVSDTPIEVHEPTRENVLAHERVNETVMRNHTVIPMSFGTVFKTRDDIIELLRSAYDAFTEVLVKMRDKLEFGLKVLWDSDVVLREIENEDEDVRRLKSEISSQKGSTYFARMQYGRLIDVALQARSERYVADIFEQLRDVAVASRANKPIGDKMIMNAAFLVSRDKEGAFDARVKAIGAKYEHLTFKYTGPWPPYNFVNIRLKLERAKDAK